jgi:hypothetical protein
VEVPVADSRTLEAAFDADSLAEERALEREEAALPVAV